MSRLARGLGLERHYSPPAQREGGYVVGPRASSRAAGERVTIESALALTSVSACIRMIANTIGTTPLIPYRDLNGDRRRARDGPQWEILHSSPNPAMSPTDFFTTCTTWLVGWGDAFIGKQFARNGELVALWPIHPGEMTVTLERGQRRFTHRPRGEASRTYSSGEVIQVMAQSYDGLRGVSPIHLARNELAVSMAAQNYAAAVYQNTAVPRGVLKHKDILGDEGMDRLRADWQRIYGGSSNAGRVAILEEGMEFEAISMPMRDVQFVEREQLSVQQIARIFGVPLSMIQADSPGGLTYRTAETENLQFLTHSIRPWYVRFEQAFNRDRDVFPNPLDFCEFLPEALLKVATLERFQAYQIATGNKPWMKPSEIRHAETLPDDPTIDDVPEPVAPAAPAPDAEPADTPV